MYGEAAQHRTGLCEDCYTYRVAGFVYVNADASQRMQAATGNKSAIMRFPLDGNAVVFAQFQQAVAVTLADGANFPLAVAAVDLRENQRGVFAAHAGSVLDVQRCGVAATLSRASPRLPKLR